jgi:RHS repeat-associated protein
MINTSGQVVWSAVYDAFGLAEVDAASVVENNLRFPGQYYDAETGLHYNWHRYYDPGTGRYMTVDPLFSNFLYKGKSYFVIPFFLTQPFRIHLYRYTNNSPVNEFDPRGLFSPQKPGCDGVPDIMETKCRRICCDDHDDCYKKNKCTAKDSWKEWSCGKENECTECNQEVWNCFTDCSITDTIGDEGNEVPKLIDITF